MKRQIDAGLLNKLCDNVKAAYKPLIDEIENIPKPNPNLVYDTLYTDEEQATMKALPADHLIHIDKIALAGFSSIPEGVIDDGAYCLKSTSTYSICHPIELDFPRPVPVTAGLMADMGVRVVITPYAANPADSVINLLMSWYGDRETQRITVLPDYRRAKATGLLSAYMRYIAEYKDIVKVVDGATDAIKSLPKQYSTLPAALKANPALVDLLPPELRDDYETWKTKQALRKKSKHPKTSVAELTEAQHRCIEKEKLVAEQKVENQRRLAAVGLVKKLNG